MVGPILIDIPADLRERQNVRWVGPIARGEVAKWYREADVFMFPTHSDGFGLTQLEAQAWKLPVIASPFCGEVVQPDHELFTLTNLTTVWVQADVYEKDLGLKKS